MVEWLRENVDRLDEDDDDDMDDVEWLRMNLQLFENEDEEEDCDNADGPSGRDNDEQHVRWLQLDGELHTSYSN